MIMKGCVGERVCFWKFKDAEWTMLGYRWCSRSVRFSFPGLHATFALEHLQSREVALYRSQKNEDAMTGKMGKFIWRNRSCCFPAWGSRPVTFLFLGLQATLDSQTCTIQRNGIFCLNRKRRSRLFQTLTRPHDIKQPSHKPSTKAQY